jgi:hypothetical protein
MNRRQFLAAAPVAAVTAPAAPSKQPDQAKYQDDWSPSEKKTRQTLPCEKMMILRLWDLQDALHDVMQAHNAVDEDGCCDCEYCTESWHIDAFLEGQEALIRGVMLLPDAIDCDAKAKREKARRKRPVLSEKVADQGLIWAMIHAVKALDRVIDVHGDGCPCRYCDDSKHLRWFIDMNKNLQSCLVPLSLSTVDLMERYERAA